MKASKFLLILLIAGLSFFSCKKSSSSTTDSTVTSADEAASTIGASISANGYGLTAQIIDAIPVGTNGKLGLEPIHSLGNLEISKNLMVAGPSICGLTKDTIINRQNSSTSPIQFSFYLNYSFQVNCTQNTPSSLVFIDSTSGTYSGPRINYNGHSKGNMTVTNLPIADSTLIFNGSYTRTGTSQSKVANKSNFTSTVTLTITNLTIGKNSHFISGGTGTITIVGASSAGKTFSYTGTVDFSNAKKLIVFIEGKKYFFDLFTGEELAVI